MTTRIVRAESSILALAAIKYQNGAAQPLYPYSGVPLIDGVSLSASEDGKVEVTGLAGKTFTVSHTNWVPGHLYIGEGGLLTQDFTAAAATGWVICVGWALSPTEFIYEPQVPTRFPFSIKPNACNPVT